jgi:hypothetical protein
MTTNGSTIYDALNTLIGTTLTAYKRITNPYEPEENAEIMMKKAYGVAFSSGSNSQRDVTCSNLYLTQNYTGIIINQITCTDNDTTGYATAQKNIFDDYISIAKAITKSPDMSVGLKTLPISHNGVEFFTGLAKKYIAIQFTIESEFKEGV